jgi:AhpC/TSA family protein
MWKGGRRARSRDEDPLGDRDPGAERSAPLAWQRAQRALSVLLVLLAVSLVGPISGQARRTPAPGFTLPTLDGKTVSLAEMKGSPIVLLFWAPW